MMRFELRGKIGGAPEMFTAATSMPSTEVPDIIPSTSIDFSVFFTRRYLPLVLIPAVSAMRQADSVLPGE